MPMRDIETYHFWVGHVPVEIAGEYFVEAVNTSDDPDDPTPLSPFAIDQNVEYYDHDFLEYGWGHAPSLLELFQGYSYAEQWGEELAARCEAARLKDVNFFAFINEEEIEEPKSVRKEQYWLQYMGTIKVKI